MYSILWFNPCPSDHLPPDAVPPPIESSFLGISSSFLVFDQKASLLSDHPPHSEDICGSQNLPLWLHCHCGYGTWPWCLTEGFTGKDNEDLLKSSPQHGHPPRDSPEKHQGPETSVESTASGCWEYETKWE